MLTVSTSRKRKAEDGDGLHPRDRSRNTSSGVLAFGGETSSSENNRKRKKIISPTFVPSEADDEEVEADVEMSDIEKSSPEVEETSKSQSQSEKSEVDESAISMSRMTIKELEKLRDKDIAKEKARAEMAEIEVTKE